MIRRLVLSVIIGGFTSFPAQAEGRYLFDLLKIPAYSKSFHAIVAPIVSREKWLGVKIPTGPGGKSKSVVIAGQSFELVDTCKQHDCGDNRMSILFSEGGATAAAILRQPRGDTFLGNPAEPQRAVLAKSIQ